MGVRPLPKRRPNTSARMYQEAKLLRKGAKRLRKGSEEEREAAEYYRRLAEEKRDLGGELHHRVTRKDQLWTP